MARAVAKRAVVRASQRERLVDIDLAGKGLKDLMVEQCRDLTDDYVTIYRGSQGQLIAAGVPLPAFPAAGATSSSFRVKTINCCSTGKYERLRGSMAVLAPDSYELEILWGGVMPYFQGEHPAITELSRQISLSLMWIREKDMVAPLDEIARDPTSGYLPGRKHVRVQLTPEFMDCLVAEISRLCHFVHRHGEVVPAAVLEPGSAARAQPTLRLVVDSPRGL